MICAVLDVCDVVVLTQYCKLIKFFSKSHIWGNLVSSLMLDDRLRNGLTAQKWPKIRTSNSARLLQEKSQHNSRKKILEKEAWSGSRDPEFGGR